MSFHRKAKLGMPGRYALVQAWQEAAAGLQVSPRRRIFGGPAG